MIVLGWFAAVARGAAVFALCWATAALAGPTVDLFSPDTLVVAGDFRLATANGERSWVDGGFGKLRFGDQTRVALGSGDLVWQPKLGWALSATVVGSVQQRHRLEAGLSEAYLSFKPLTGGSIRFSARAGLMWPPVSLEHGGPEWAVRDTITPSAINSWVGEEVKFVGAEGTVSLAAAGNKFDLSAAMVDANDTAGTLLAFRGWALHDLKVLAWRKQPLPPLSPQMAEYQPQFTHALKEMDHGYLRRPGWYVRTALRLAAPVKVEAVHYDNGGDPEAVDRFYEWGWRTRFNNVGVTAELSPGTQLRAQAMQGHSVMGFEEEGRRLVDMRFRSAFALLTQRLGERASASARIEAFDTRNRGSELDRNDDEHGWALTAAGKHTLSRDLTVLGEIVRVESRREARLRVGQAPHQVQLQFQGSLRLRW